MTSLATPFPDVQITTVSGGPFFIDALFRRKFNDAAPDYGRSVIAFYRRNWTHFMPFCYANFLLHEGVILVGGAMTDGEVMRQMPQATCEEIRAAGGIYHAVLKYAFQVFAPDCEAFFGYAADERALEVDLAAGFEHTPHEHLIAHFHRPLSARRQRRLIRRIHALGPF